MSTLRISAEDASTTAKRQQKELKKRVNDLKKQQKKQKSKSMLKTQQVDERCMNSNQLSIKTTCVKN
jgi:hypothetical protein